MMSKLCPKCQYFVRPPLLSSTTLILFGMEFTRAAQFVAGILFHSSTEVHNNITELLDVKTHGASPPSARGHVLNRVQVWKHTWPLHHLHLQQQGSCHLGGVFRTVSEERASSSASECHSTCWNPRFPQLTAAPQYQQ